MGKKKNKRTMLIAALLAICMLPALALLKTSVFGKEKNAIITDNTTRYDIVADLDGGKFELGTKPEFTKMDNGKWLHKYKPTMLPTKIPKPVKDGYTFVGWTIEGETTPKPEYSIPSWNKKNINLTANWKAVDSVLLDGLSFNSALRYSDNYKNINHIKFVKGYPDPNGIDLSEKHDKSIMGSFKDGIFTIACEGKILANPDCYGMFRYMQNLTNITFDSFDTSNVTDMGEMFAECINISVLDVSTFNTSNVDNMQEMFALKSSYRFEDLIVPTKLVRIVGLENFNTSNVGSMSGMFSGCNALTELNVHNFDTSRLIYMDNMFCGCTSLTSIDLSNFDTSNVTEMSNLFRCCSKLTKIDVSNFNTESVLGMIGIFATGLPKDRYYSGYESELRTIVGLNSLNMSNVTHAREMFGGCAKLSGEITIDNFKVTNYDKMFYGCSSDPNAEFWVKWKTPEDKELARRMMETKNSGDHVYLWEPPSTLKEGVIFYRDVMHFIPGATTATEIKFIKATPDPNGLDLSEKRDKSIMGVVRNNVIEIACAGEMYANPFSDSMFSMYGHPDGMNTVLNKITFENFNTSKVVTMAGMFADCYKLKQIDLSGFNTTNVKDMSCMFSGCKSLETLDVSNLNTSNVTNMFGMFCLDGSKVATDWFNPSKLHKIVGLDRFDTSNVTNMSKMFERCDNITSLDVSNFNTSNVIDMSGMFKECSKLESIDVSNFNTSKVTNMSEMFSTGRVTDIFNVGSHNPNDIESNLKSIVGLDNLDMSKVTNTSKMFEDNISLSGEMTIDNLAVTNYIDMFIGCSQSPSTEFWVKWKTPEDKELARKMVETKNPNDHVYLWEPSSTLINGDLFHRKINAIRDPYIKHIKFVVGNPNPDGIDFSEKKDKSITGVVNGETLTISCAGKIMANPYSATMFYYLTTLTDIDFDNFDTSNVTRMDNMFSTCVNLETIRNIENWNINKVTHMNGMFHKCQKLKNLNLSKWKTGKLVDIENMFQYCNNLGDLDLRGFDVSEVTSLMCVFEFCNSLKTVDITGWDTHNVEKMEVAFDGCLSLVEIKGLENIDTSKCFNYGKTFKDCGKLCGEITVKSSITIDDLSHTFHSFRCFENASTDQNSRFVVKYINKESHGNAGQLVNEKSPNSNVFLYNEPCTLIDGPTFNSTIVNKEYSSIRNIIFEQDVPHNMSKYPYKDLSVAKDKSIVAYVDGDTLKVASDGKIMANEDCSEMFRRYGLKEFDLSTISFNNFDVSNTISMWGMFYECPASKITGLERWDTSKVLDFEAIFLGTTNLQSINLRDWDLSNAQYGIPSFGRSGVKEVNVTGWNFGNQTDISNIFKDTYFLTRIIGLNTWDVSNITHMRSLFEGCGMKSIDLSSWDTRSLKDIGNMFYFCSGLESIVGLENLNTDNINHYESAFEACPRLTATLTIKKVATFGHLDRPHVTSALNNCSTEPNALFTIQYVDASTKDVAKWFIALSNTDDDKTTHVELKYIGEGPEPINTKEETKPNILNKFKSAFNPNKSTTPKPTTQGKTVNITLINGPSAMFQTQTIQHKAGKIGYLPKPDLNPKYAGQFGGYYYDQNCTIPVKPNDIVTQDIELYAKW